MTHSFRKILSSSLFVVGLAAQTLPSGKYVVTLADGGMALDADGPGMNTNDGKAHLWQNNGGTTQVWTVSSTGGNTYTIVLTATGKALDADGPGMHTDGGKVHLWDFNGGKTQKWRIQSTGSNTYAIILADGGKAVDAGIASMHDNDGLVHLWAANLGKTQKWFFTAWVQGSPTELTLAPQATPAELDEFNNVVNNQNGVGVLGGENTGPFYFHANQPNELVYKYRKLLDSSKLPQAGLNDLLGGVKNHVVGDVSLALGDVGEAIDQAVDCLPLIGNNCSNMKWIDCWYPVSEKKATICGTVNDVGMCTQDYLHTQLTVDKDFNLDIKPGPAFQGFLNNRWITKDGQSQPSQIEGEVRLNTVSQRDPRTVQTAPDTITPTNPLPMKIPAGANVCAYGPWMADILDINARIPLINNRIDIKNLNTNNEIHPMNQVWVKKADGLDLFAFGDGSGYFEKTGNGEIEASGLNHPMRFYVAFQISKPGRTAVAAQTATQYEINGTNYDITTSPDPNVEQQTLSLTYQNAVRLVVNDNTTSRTARSHSVFFDKIRSRSDGTYQGYIVVETVPIVSRGGSININVKIRPTGGPTRVQ